MSDEKYITNYDSDKNSNAQNESQDNQNSNPQSSRKKKQSIQLNSDKFRERWLLGRFVHKSLDIVDNWSQDRNPSSINWKHFHEIPIL